MSGSFRGPAYPIFVVLPQALQRARELVALADPIAAACAPAHPVGADLYLRSSTGMALVALFFDPRFLSTDVYQELTVAASRAAAAIVDVAQLPERARQRFHQEYLPLYDVRIGGLRGVTDAMQALADHAAGGGRLLPAPVEVKLRRGDAWQLGRVRSMTREGISIATCTPPKRGDLVDLEISAAGVTLLARSTVVGVALGDAATALGATGFGARFIIAGEQERRKLQEILRAVGADKLRALEPPPHRRGARYPVHWPVQLRSRSGRISRAALDVSRHGLFIGCEAGESCPTDGPVHVTIPIDDRGTPILATGRVARAIAEDLAARRGLSRGIGVEITAISQRDDARFSAFVARVARRAEREVIVGAVEARLAELTPALTAVGYCASGVSDAAGLVTRAAAAPHAPDLVLIDSSLSRENPIGVQAARRALAVRMVPLMSIDGDSAEATREIVDGTLLPS